MSGYVTDVSYTIRFQRELAPEWLDAVAVVCGTRPPGRTGGFAWCDLGCGSGLTAATLAASHPEGRFVGIDLMPAHVENARRLAKDAEKTGGICCAITIGGHCSGICSSSSSIACVPPVDAPIATRVELGNARTAGAGAGVAVSGFRSLAR